MIRNNQGNIRVIQEVGCDLNTAEEALKHCNSWSDTFKYARLHNER